MIKNLTISQNNFEKLLKWLDTDRETAGQKYELIRLRLIKIFSGRGCHWANELADETIDRVTKKVDSLLESYEGDPALYFYAVAKKVYLEFSRKPKAEELPRVLAQKENTTEVLEVYSRCLDKCLQNLMPEQREFIIDYYQGEKQAKITHRKDIELKLGITNKVLRVRVFRVRKALQKCLLNCVQENSM
ncbi:MAG: hypothetical protein WKF90_14540 [Pyrinomonadaceae bacterium]